MLQQILNVFELVPDINLSLMEENQSLASFSSRAIDALDWYIKNFLPHLVIVQGDTTTTFIAALASYYNEIPIAHIEAGLRTWNKKSPFPEEINRVLTTKLSDYHFAPTEWAKTNLIKEGISEERVWVTGNTVIDALLYASEKIEKSPPKINSLPEDFIYDGSNHELILITGHRRENFGIGFKNICNAIADLATMFPNIHFVYPVHLNPNVKKPVFNLLGGIKNVHLIEPLNYLQFVLLMKRSKLILTDSGGIQEEAPSLGKPVLVMRETSERPEGIEAGTVKLIGTQKYSIIKNVAELLTSSEIYNAMSKVHNPYGDGKASERIVTICETILNKGFQNK